MSTLPEDQPHSVLDAPPSVAADVVQRACVQRRTVRTLVLTQALGGIGLSTAVSIATLLALDVSGSEKLAGLAQTVQVLGAAVVAVLLARYMSTHGRRPGLSLGYGLGALGAVTCIVAGVMRLFPLLLLGALLLGATTAANNQARYAATDLSLPARRGRDLSLVVWATTLGSVLGPNLVGPGGFLAGRLHLPPLTGAFVFAAAGMVLAGVVMTVRMRPDPLLTARALRVRPEGAADAVSLAEHAVDTSSWRRTWALMASRPLVLAATVGMALSHAVMVSVMVMTPIHMSHGHASLEIIGLVISFHVLGMFGFSPLVGLAVDRFGSPRVLGVGGLVLLASLVTAGLSPSGASWSLGVGLLLLGLGWSIGMVSSSTLLTAATPEPNRPDVQGTADLTTGFTAAAGGAVAGVIVGWLGFNWLAGLASVLALGVVLVAVLAGRHTERLSVPA